MMLKPFRKEKSKEGSLEIWFEEKGCGRWNNILVVLLFISHCVGIRRLIQILFSYCFLLIYSVFKLVQSTKTQYLCHQGEKKKTFQAGPWNSEYQKFKTPVNQIYTCFAS